MCGIAGFLNLKKGPIDHKLLEKMKRSLVHRGPDNQQIYADETFACIFTRLAIIDLSVAADQPMVSGQHDWVLAFNGTLYNYLELKKDLIKQGYFFKTKSDTEVILHAIDNWGEKSFAKFKGMFAIVAYDRGQGRLLLARDRYGMKPLYTFFTNERLYFASEIKALLSVLPGKLNKNALVQYFHFQNIFTSDTLFTGVERLKPGHFSSLALGDSKLVSQCFWQFDFFAEDESLSETECLESLDTLLHQAVANHLIGDVEVGAFLSGGLDTSSIVYLMQQNQQEISTFTCGFDLTQVSGLELNYDESQAAASFAAQAGLNHRQIILGPNHLERALPNLIWHLEDLRMGQCYPNYYGARLAHNSVKVVLGGTGSDEIFAGYTWRYLQNSIFASVSDFIATYFNQWQRLLSVKESQSFFVGPNRSHTESIRSIFSEVFDLKAALQTKEDCIRHCLHFEANTFLPGLLAVDDRLTMAHSLELRLPFLDNDLVDFALKVPLRYKLILQNQRSISYDENQAGNKIESTFQKSRNGKLILRKLLARYVGKEVAERPKQGFAAPDTSWYRGPTMAFIKSRLLCKESHLFDYLNRSTVHSIVQSHLSGRRNRRLLIWSLLCFDSWLEVFQS